MPYPCHFTVVYTLDGVPTMITAHWVDPEGRHRCHSEQLDTGATEDTVADCVRHFADALDNDPF